jgi:hypothetical protein
MTDGLATYVFCGSSVSDMMGVVSFRRFGQRAQLTEQQARDLALGGSAIVPAEKFDSLGFSEAELKRYAEFGTHGNAPAEFRTKLVAALVGQHEFRTSLEPAPEPVTEPVTEVAGG